AREGMHAEAIGRAGVELDAHASVVAPVAWAGRYNLAGGNFAAEFARQRAEVRHERCAPTRLRSTGSRSLPRTAIMSAVRRAGGMVRGALPALPVTLALSRL